MQATLVYTLLTLAPLAARADLQLDQDDISQACSAVCRPTRELSQTCDVDDDRLPDDRTEDLLTLQCLCLNDSFDVADLTSLCASCMSQNPVSDDDDGSDDNTGMHAYQNVYSQVADNVFADDINEIMSRCGFTSASYAASQSTAADGIVVAATRPTSASDLTTTVAPGVGGATPTASTSATGTPLTSGTTSTGTSTGTGTATGTATQATGSASTGAATAGASGFRPLEQGWAAMIVGGAVAMGWMMV